MYRPRSRASRPSAETHRSTASSPNSRTSLAAPESSAKYAKTPSITSGLYQAHRSPADHGDWHWIGSLSPKPSSTPCCGTAQLAAPRVPGFPPYTSCTRIMVGVPASTTEHSTPGLSPTATPSVISMFTPVFSKIDLVRAYNQISVHPNDISRKVPAIVND
jgi:hypothetical protein